MSCYLRELHQARNVRHSDGLDPLIATNEGSSSEFLGMVQIDLLDASPFDSIGRGRTRTIVFDLSVEECVESEVTHPWQPTLRLDEALDMTLHNDGS